MLSRKKSFLFPLSRDEGEWIPNPPGTRNLDGIRPRVHCIGCVIDTLSEMLMIGTSVDWYLRGELGTSTTSKTDLSCRRFLLRKQ
jgi:hypothetical protein